MLPLDDTSGNVMKAPEILNFFQETSIPALVALVGVAWALSRWIRSERFAAYSHDHRSADFWVRVYEALTNRTVDRRRLGEELARRGKAKVMR
jgi:hypothetical protein